MCVVGRGGGRWRRGASQSIAAGSGVLPIRPEDLREKQVRSEVPLNLPLRHTTTGSLWSSSALLRDLAKVVLPVLHELNY